jgi:hypothetical protein
MHLGDGDKERPFRLRMRAVENPLPDFRSGQFLYLKKVKSRRGQALLFDIFRVSPVYHPARLSPERFHMPLLWHSVRFQNPPMVFTESRKRVSFAANDQQAEFEF